MFIRKYSLCEEAGDGNGGGASGSQNELQKKVDDLIAENARMADHQKKLLDETKNAKKALKQFEGIDPDNIKDMMKTLESSEEAKLLAEGKLDDVLGKRTEKMRLSFEEKQQNYETKIGDLESSFKSLREQYNNEKISLAIRQAAEKSGAIPDAIDDIINRANGVFSIGDDGSIESRDPSGEIVTVNKKALDPVIFVEQLKESAPFMWPGSQGHGASGKIGGKNVKNPFKKGDNYNLTEQAKLMNENPELAQKLKAAAG